MSLREDYLTLKQDLIDIADAIRAKKGIKKKMKLDEMAKVIEKDDRVLEINDTSNTDSDDYQLKKLMDGEGYQTDENETEISFEKLPVTCLKYRAFFPSSVSLPSNVYLTNLKLGSIEKIDEQACYNCVNLISVNAENVVEIGYQAFHNATSQASQLQDFIAPKAEKIGNEAFRAKSFNCGPQFLNFPFTNVKEIGESAFENSRITEIYVPNLEVLGQKAFYYCQPLKKVTLSAIKEITANSFQGTALSELYLLGTHFCPLTQSLSSSLQVYVRKELIDLYKNDPIWNKSIILPLPEEVS